MPELKITPEQQAYMQTKLDGFNDCFRILYKMRQIMPETNSELKPLPCPACGSEHTVVAKNFTPWFTAGSHVLCVDCQMQGPIACSQREEDATTIEDLREMIEPTGFESAAITAWNALPRALTWTTEQPKVPGWYFRRHNISGRWSEADAVNLTSLSRRNRIIRSAMIQWAGPITPPLETSKAPIPHAIHNNTQPRE